MIYLYYIFSMLNILDAILTYYLLESGKGYESSPFMSALIATGWINFFVLKTIGAFTIIAICHTQYKSYPKICIMTMTWFIIFYLFIVLNNFFLAVKP